ncbi:MAG: AfsR/SARP family transcriptional regulator, partial [Clostridia bacterium]
SKAAETTHSIVVQCFGAFQVLGPLGPVKWRTSKAEEVFSYLWLQQECHVDNIISDIFPDHDSLKVKQYLHTCIYLIRKSLKQAGIDDALVISFERDRYRITYTDVQCDSQQFLELAQAIQLKPDVKLLTGALALYTEGLMVNLESFWIYKHREKFYQLYLQLMEQLVTLLLSRQDGRQALEYAKQLVHLEPLDENYTLLLIESYQGLGKWAKAEETFEQFSQKLHHELGEQVSTRFLEQYHYLEKRR